MSVASAFFKRDLSLNLSYRLSFTLQLFGILFSVASSYFVSRMFGSTSIPQLAPYGGDYFPFALIGIAFFGYMTISLTGFSASIREGQVMGTLEIMLLSPTRLSIILLSSSLWSYFFTTLNVIVYMVLGVLIFGFDLSHANIATSLVVLMLSVACFSSIGILSAAMVLVFKKGDPISTFYGSISSLLAGVFYPTTILPDQLQTLARFVPLTYALDGMRLAVLQGYGFSQLKMDIFVLVGFTVVMVPIALLVFRLALHRAKREGSLVHY